MTKMISPATEQEASEIIADASNQSKNFCIRGAGSKSAHWASCDADTLTSSALTGIVDYDPAELVMTARAGTSMADIESALHKNNQLLAFEPGNWGQGLSGSKDQTIGGIFAANQSGSRRFFAGAARDALLGVRFVNGRGEIIKNGGRVMKNVTGLDLVKLMGGSWGSLGFLTQVSFKVQPKAATQRTLAIASKSTNDATSIMAAAMATSCDVTGAAHLSDSVMSRIAGGALSDRQITLLRLQGFEESVSARVEKLRKTLTGATHIDVLDQTVSSAIWADINALTPFSDNLASSLWRVSLPPSKGIDFATEIANLTACKWLADWQGGLIWLEVSDQTLETVNALRSGAVRAGGHSTCVRNGDGIAGFPMFQPQAPAIEALQSRVKASMDPTGVFRSPIVSAQNPSTLAA